MKNTESTELKTKVILNVTKDERQRLRIFAAMNDLSMSAAGSMLLLEGLNSLEATDKSKPTESGTQQKNGKEKSLKK